MTIYFCNREAIDLMAFEIMGLNAKAEGTNPIGFFGTGLKYAVATLLRLGCEVQVTRQQGDLREHISFFSEAQEMRGKEFHRVVMRVTNAATTRTVPLGFTTELGKNWEAWMAFRELHSNVLDEQGQTSDQRPGPETDWGTVIAVQGAAMQGAYADRHKVFLEPRLAKLPSADAQPCCEIVPLRGPYMYYRGVRVGEYDQMPAMATYNLLAPITLTEDRTVASMYSARTQIATAMLRLKDKAFLRRVLLAEKVWFESRLEYHSFYEPTAEFLEVCKEERRNRHLNPWALRVWQEKNPQELANDWEDLEQTARQVAELQRAFGLLDKLGVQMARSDFKVVRGLGEGVMGTFFKETREIMISEDTVNMGHRVIASTLYEEWLHKTEGLRDETRAMQNYLFNKLIAMVEQEAEVPSAMGQLVLEINKANDDEMPS